MHKTFTLLALIAGTVWPGAGSGQMWCPPGAEWTHGYHAVDWSNGITHEGTMVARYAGDTVVGGQVAQRIEQDVYYEVVGADGQHHAPWPTAHTRTADGVVWWWNGEDQQYDTLIWFGAVPGDRWTVPVQGDPDLSYHVTDTATVLMQGVELRRLAVSLIYSGGEEPWLYVTDTLYERIGSSSYPALWPPHPFLDVLIISFRCYRDDGMAYTAPDVSDCAFDVGVDEAFSRDRPVLAPNPGRDHVRLLADGPHTITFTDMAGRTVLHARTDGRGQVDVSALPPGMYVYTIADMYGAVNVHGCWVKE
ncbi:MAG: T9SS type A sorting domain-containing protein [Flavobacteriales bacterium]|jgi:hypothetical protein|nr:T9SS type A sorting domain-containing protein [Flavobacteriales bacterium]